MDEARKTMARMRRQKNDEQQQPQLSDANVKNIKTGREIYQEYDLRPAIRFRSD